MPVETFELSTREPDVAHTVLTDLYCPERAMRFSGVSSSFALQIRTATGGDLAADRLRFIAGMQRLRPPQAELLVADPVVGIRPGLRDGEEGLTPGGEG